MTAAVLAVGTIAAVVAAPPEAHAKASSIGGDITRSEIIARATNWYERRYDSDLTYSMSSYTWDGTHSRKYRRDCSGFVGMAWHLGADPSTRTLDSYAYPISRSALLPGDALNDSVDHESGYPYHAILFGGWENSAKTTFWYYSFGSTPVRKVHGASFGDSTLSGHPTGDYRALRYENVVEDSSPEDYGLADVTGDGFTDVVALRPDGTMWLYSNNFVRDDGIPYSSGREVAHGWNNYDRILASDATGDGYTDLLAVTPDGTMRLYSNNFERDDGDPYSGSGREVAHGWNNYDRILPADATGDGYTDLLALRPDGTMWLYSNNFERDDGDPYSGSGRQIGHGWNNYDRIIPSDVTGDGYTDILAVRPDGTMWLYSNNFERDDGMPYGSARQVAHGWNNYDRLIASDVTGDGYTDLIALRPDGTMWLYSNSIVRDDGDPVTGTGRQIGHGWNNYDRIIT